jgi:DNA polymerase V
VMLTGLVRREAVQQGLFDGTDRHRSTALMAALDEINGRFGRDAVVFGAARLPSRRREWTTRHQRLSPEYTTSWGGLAVVRA